MRTRQALKNMITSLLLEAVLAISGIIVPQLFTTVYGSAVNGLVSSISQFISYMSLVEAGIGAAGTVSLYSPLAKKDHEAVSAIVSAAKKFYLNSGLIFVAMVAGLVLLYPVVVQNEIQNASFVRTMILVLSVSGIVDYFFLGKYRVLLQADQKSYVIYLAQIIGTILMAVISIALIKIGTSAVLVKSVTAVIYIMRSLIVAAYVKRNYPQVSFSAKPNMAAFGQRWSALLHQIVNMIVNNTHLILLTLMLPENALAEVSVYSVYSLVCYALVSLINSIANGIRSSFGQIISNGEERALKNSFGTYEILMLMLTFIAYACMAVLLYPFVSIYSANFADGVTYARWPVVGLFAAMGLIQALRIPGTTIIIAAGHYKQTQGRAIAEASINFLLAIALVRPLGIVGVLLASCASYLYRSIDVIFYTAKHFLPGTLQRTGKRLLRNGLAYAVLVYGGIRIIPAEMGGWLSWFTYAMMFGMIAVAVIGLVNLLAEPAEFRACIRRVKSFANRPQKG